MNQWINNRWKLKCNLFTSGSIAWQDPALNRKATTFLQDYWLRTLWDRFLQPFCIFTALKKKNTDSFENVNYSYLPMSWSDSLLSHRPTQRVLTFCFLPIVLVTASGGWGQPVRGLVYSDISKTQNWATSCNCFFPKNPTQNIPKDYLQGR